MKSEIADYESQLVATACGIFSAAVLFGSGYGIWENVPTNLHLVALVASLGCYILGFGVLCANMTNSRWATQFSIAGLFVAFIAYSSTYLLFKVPYYSSDALLFNSYSAQLVLSGVDPYTHSMQPGYRIFGVPESEVTPTADGSVFSLSYPALSFLVYVPFLAAGVSNLLWVSVLAHIAVLGILVAIAPGRLKCLAPLVLFIDPSYFDYTVGGITDVLWLAPGLLAAYYWSSNPVISAVFLGIASSVKQTPWVIIPFALAHWGMQAVRTRNASAFIGPLAALIGTFFVPNAPFILWHPNAWLKGVFTPLAAHLVILGSGISQLGAAGVMPLTPRVFLLLTALAFVCLFGLYIAFPKRYAFLPFFAPALVFFFAARSLQNYFMYWPIVLFGYVFAKRSIDPNDSPISKPLIIGSCVIVGVSAICALQIVTHDNRNRPEIAIIGKKLDSRTGRIAGIRIVARNPAPFGVRFRLDIARQGDGFDVESWRPLTPFVLAAHEAREILLTAPSADAEFQPNGKSDVQVISIQSNGLESTSRPNVFPDTPPKIHNQDLLLWSYGARPFPVAWYFDSDAWSRGDIARAQIAGHPAAFLHAAERGVGSKWNATSLQQIVDGRPCVLSFLVYPMNDYDGVIQPSSLFGATVVDAVGRRYYFVITTKANAGVSYQTQWGIVRLVSGRIHEWNTILVDLNLLSRSKGFALGPDMSIGVGAFAAARTGEAGGYFGGVSSRSS